MDNPQHVVEVPTFGPISVGEPRITEVLLSSEFVIDARSSVFLNPHHPTNLVYARIKFTISTGEPVTVVVGQCIARSSRASVYSSSIKKRTVANYREDLRRNGMYARVRIYLVGEPGWIVEITWRWVGAKLPVTPVTTRRLHDTSGSSHIRKCKPI